MCAIKVHDNWILHRIDGPAIDCDDGIYRWYYKGEYLKHITSQKQYEQWLKLKAFW